MKSRLLVTSSMFVLIFGGVIFISKDLSFAQEPAGKPANMEKAPAPSANVTEPAPSAVGTKIEVGNKICPIEGDKIVEGKSVKVEYNGKIYNLCCSMCEKELKKDPEAAIKKLEMMEKEKMEGKEEENDMDADDMPGTDGKNMNMETPGTKN